MGDRRGGSVSGRRAPLGGAVNKSAWLTLLVICVAVSAAMVVVPGTREHERRHGAFLAACVRGGHDGGQCDFYWLMLADRARSNDAALSVINSTTH